jgi:pimeloyl-ACP methyl ester carboxylesterase
MSDTDPVVVLVNGAWHRPKPTWDLVRESLDARHIRSAAVTLATANPVAGSLPGLEDDVAATVAVIDSVDGPVVLCGHSYGGMVISEAGHHDAVTGLVYLAAFCFAEGQTVLEIAAVDPPPPIADAVVFRDDGLMTIEPSRARDVFYEDVDSELAERAASALVPSVAAIFSTSQGDPAWRQRPSTYVVCERDRAIPVGAQHEMSQRCAERVVLDSSHSPFLSMPGRVVDVLVGSCERARG